MPPPDLNLRSFVPVAADGPFPIQNLPYGVFRAQGGPAHLGVAIGELVLDLTALEAKGLLPGPWFRDGTLNAFMAEGPAAWQAARARITQLLRADEPTLRDD